MEQYLEKLLNWVREAIRHRHSSFRTEQSYVAWIRPTTKVYVKCFGG